MSTPLDPAAFRLAVTRLQGAAQLTMLMEEGAFSVAALARIHLHGDALEALSSAVSVGDLLPQWDRHFDALQTLAAQVRAGRVESLESLQLDDAIFVPPTGEPPRMFYAAANYSDHVAGMRKTFKSGLPEPGQPTQSLRPYLFLKACAVTGAQDDIVLPTGMQRIDWEAELAVVIGRRARRVTASQAMDTVAGFMTTNDVSCRDLTWREDRPSIRSDWFSGKSFDSFAPMGPYFLPRAFVRDPRNLAIRLWVNGAIKQDGNTRDMTFGIDAQIEFASSMVTLQPGDLFATGTPAGTGQERLEFLREGDLVETEVQGCGRQRNRVVTERRDEC